MADDSTVGGILERYNGRCRETEKSWTVGTTVKETL